MSSPAERYAAARLRATAARTSLAGFAADLPFELDPFQVQACTALEAGRGVLVAAPTGAGKTVVGEFAIQLALSKGQKAFYTTPIKALSNQKYADLARRHGAEQVGLLTGDTTLNGDAPVVVMTTEVLRNMLYAGSSTLKGLAYVVMDEVHYLADRFRGPVWEEVIIHLPSEVALVSLSATVSNAEEFGDWLTMVRGDTAVVVSETRPVPLWQHVMTRNGIFDLYAGDVDPTAPGVDPPINPDLLADLRRQDRTSGTARSGPGDRGYRGRGGRRPDGVSSARRPPPRFAVVEVLDREALLPAIFFVFSRAGCEAAVQQCMGAGLRLTTPEQAAAIRDTVERRCGVIGPQDLAVLGYWEWSQALERGIASHHAGLLPLFKETVEELFSRGLVKVVFATETLALGINMPARSVVLDRLVEWGGSAPVEITAQKSTQLTGRALHMGRADPLHQAVQHHRPGGHVDAQRERLGGEDHLHEATGEQLLDGLLEQREQTRVVRGDAPLQRLAPLPVAEDRQVLRPDDAAASLDGVPDRCGLLRGGQPQAGAHALLHRRLAPGTGEDEEDRRQQRLTIEHLDHGEPRRWSPGRRDAVRPAPASAPEPAVPWPGPRRTRGPGQG